MNAAQRRPHFRQGLSSIYTPFYDALCGRLGPEWQPYSSIRTFDQQTALYNQGRTTPPLGPEHVVTNAPAGTSAHNYACATDWTYFEGETLLWLKKSDSKWQQYIEAVRSVGLKAGADFGDTDHNEVLISCDWPHVLIAYQQGGMTAAQQHIEANLVNSAPLTP